MDKDFLKKTAIFRGMKDSELDAALSALKSSENDFSKDEVILYAGSTTNMMGLVLEGSVRITVLRFGGFDSLDLIGNRSCLIHTEKWAFRFSQDETSIPYPFTGHPTVFPPTPRT